MAFGIFQSSTAFSFVMAEGFWYMELFEHIEREVLNLNVTRNREDFSSYERSGSVHLKYARGSGKHEGVTRANSRVKSSP